VAPLNLTAREAAALDRLLDAYLVTEHADPITVPLYSVREKVARLPQDHAGLGDDAVPLVTS
jgi:hypothetical protein